MRMISFIVGVAAVQRDDGSFSASVEGNEYDMRFVYCAAAICAMLNDWGTVNKEKMAEYILKSIVRKPLKNIMNESTKFDTYKHVSQCLLLIERV